MDAPEQKKRKRKNHKQRFRGKETNKLAGCSLVYRSRKKKLKRAPQEDNRGGFSYNFSGAEFSGAAPDPRNFMGGVKYR